MERNILVMAKHPRPGYVKTRLQPFLTPYQSADLALALLEDTLSLCREIAAQLWIAFDPEESREFFEQNLEIEANLVVQEGADLGARMSALFELVNKPAVMIGTDCPELSTELVEEAFDRIENQTDAVFGPSTDGGFYLVGLREPRNKVFDGVKWSSTTTLREVLANVEKEQMSSSFIKTLSDIDEESDLRRAAQICGPGTRLKRWVKQNDQLFQT